MIREKGTAFHPSNTKPRFKEVGEKVHFWGIISKKGVGPIVFLESNVTKYTYMQLLDDYVINYYDHLERWYKHDFVFQQDNASSHDAICITGRQYKHEEVVGWLANVE